ncbi:MAG: hypothetical protein, partial [Olavius algarvensis Gamma 1 endosymbiont]
ASSCANRARVESLSMVGSKRTTGSRRSRSMAPL